MRSLGCYVHYKACDCLRESQAHGVTMKHDTTILTKVRFYLNFWMIFCAVLTFLPLVYAMYVAPTRELSARNPCEESFTLQYNTIVRLGGASWLVLDVLIAVILGGTFRHILRLKPVNSGVPSRHIKLVITEASVFLLLCIANLTLQSKLLTANFKRETACLDRYLTSHDIKGQG